MINENLEKPLLGVRWKEGRLKRQFGIIFITCLIQGILAILLEPF